MEKLRICRSVVYSRRRQLVAARTTTKPRCGLILTAKALDSHKFTCPVFVVGLSLFALVQMRIYPVLFVLILFSDILLTSNSRKVLLKAVHRNVLLWKATLDF